jgi:hypothetical protein
MSSNGCQTDLSALPFLIFRIHRRSSFDGGIAP